MAKLDEPFKRFKADDEAEPIKLFDVAPILISIEFLFVG